MKTSWRRAIALSSFLVAASSILWLAGDAFTAPPAGRLAAPPNPPAPPPLPSISGLADPTAAAQNGLAVLKQMATNDTYADLGFQSLAEVSKVTLGGPLSVYIIRHDELLTLAPNASPQSALHDIKQQVFPVYVEGAVRVAIVVSQAADGKWKVSSLGDAAIVKLLDNAKTTHAKATGKNHKYMVVKVPALFQMFLAHTDAAGKMHFVTVHEDADVGTAKKGDARPARNVLDLLTARAKKSAPPPSKRTK